jgi:hypothetical protein
MKILLDWFQEYGGKIATNSMGVWINHNGKIVHAEFVQIGLHWKLADDFVH